MKRPSHILLVLLIPLLLTISPTCSEFTFFYEYCDDITGNYTTRSTYQKNLNQLLPNLTNKASLSTFDTHTVGQGIDQTYGLYLCRGDLDDQQCLDCITAASSKIVEICPVQKEAIVWYKECMVRYANRSIFSDSEENPLSYSWSTSNVSNPLEFREIFSETVESLIMQAAHNTSKRGYATDHANVTFFEEVHVLVQCTPDILGNQCERCLRVALRNVAACCGKARLSMAMYLPSCWLRYAQTPFVGSFDSEDTSPDTKTESGEPQPREKLDFLPLPPPSPDRSKATISTFGVSNFLLGLLMTFIMLLCMA